MSRDSIVDSSTPKFNFAGVDRISARCQILSKSDSDVRIMHPLMEISGEIEPTRTAKVK